MNNEHFEKFERIEKDLKEAQRYLDDIRRDEENNKELARCCELISDIKTIIGNDKNVVQDSLSEDYKKQVLVIDSEINNYILSKGYSFISYPAGKKDFTDDEKYECKRVVETDNLELDNSVKQTERLGLVDENGNYLVLPQVILYKAKNEKVKMGSSLKQFISKLLTITNVIPVFLISVLLASLAWITDYNSLLFNDGIKHLFTGVLINFGLFFLTFYVLEMVSRVKSQNILISDKIILSVAIAFILVAPSLFINYSLYKIIVLLLALLACILLLFLRVLLSSRKRKANNKTPRFIIDIVDNFKEGFLMFVILNTLFALFSFALLNNESMFSNVVFIIACFIFSSVFVLFTLFNKIKKAYFPFIFVALLSCIPMTIFSQSWFVFGFILINAIYVFVYYCVGGFRICQNKN